MMHVDTTWKFREMIEFRESYARKELGLDLIVYINEEGRQLGIHPLDDSEKHTEVMKTDALKQALGQVSVRRGVWRCSTRRREIAGQGTRLFVPRPQSHVGPEEPAAGTVEPVQLEGQQGREHPRVSALQLDGTGCLAVHPPGEDPDRPALFRRRAPGRRARRRHDPGRRRPPATAARREAARCKRVRFRTLGCYPLTGAVESNATTLPEIIQEMLLTKTSERQGRVIDQDEGGAGMEEKKKRGYF